MNGGSMDRSEYERRFKARIIDRLVAPNSVWTVEQASEAAAAEWDANAVDCDYLSTPEDDADECLSYWNE